MGGGVRVVGHCLVKCGGSRQKRKYLVLTTVVLTVWLCSGGVKIPALSQSVGVQPFKTEEEMSDFNTVVVFWCCDQHCPSLAWMV